MKKKFIKGLALAMAMSTLLCNTAFATPIDLRDSVLDVQYDSLNQDQGTTYYTDENNEWANGTINEEVRVRVDLASKFEITIPKDIVLDGEAKKADYQVNVKGDIAGDQKITVVPDTDFQMNETGGKAAITATVTQPDTDFTYDQIKDAGKTVDGTVEAEDMTAGDWSGSFFFNISFTGGQASEGEDEKGYTVKLLEGTEHIISELYGESLLLPMNATQIDNKWYVTNILEGNGTYNSDPTSMIVYEITSETDRTINFKLDGLITDEQWSYDDNRDYADLVLSIMNLEQNYTQLLLQHSGAKYDVEATVPLDIKQGKNYFAISFSTDGVGDYISVIFE